MPAATCDHNKAGGIRQGSFPSEPYINHDKRTFGAAKLVARPSESRIEVQFDRVTNVPSTQMALVGTSRSLLDYVGPPRSSSTEHFALTRFEHPFGLLTLWWIGYACRREAAVHDKQWITSRRNFIVTVHHSGSRSLEKAVRLVCLQSPASTPSCNCHSEGNFV